MLFYQCPMLPLQIMCSIVTPKTETSVYYLSLSVCVCVCVGGGGGCVRACVCVSCISATFKACMLNISPSIPNISLFVSPHISRSRLLHMAFIYLQSLYPKEWPSVYPQNDDSQAEPRVMPCHAPSLSSLLTRCVRGNKMCSVFITQLSQLKWVQWGLTATT